jgi:hypothetical protein
MICSYRDHSLAVIYAFHITTQKAGKDNLPYEIYIYYNTQDIQGTSEEI